MGFYYRKSINFGGVRFNFSQSGVGVSVGVKGFRVGSGPRGNYVHMGRNGLYYRAALGTKKNTSVPTTSNKPIAQPIADDGLLFHEIESGDTSLIVDSSSKELIDEINAKKKKIPFWPCALLFAFIPEIGPPLAILCGLLIFFIIDKRRKTTILFYDIDSEVESTIQLFYDAFTPLLSCNAAWHVSAQAHTNNTKYHAGANTIVKRTKISMGLKSPKRIKTNVQIPSIPVGRQTLYFFPDRILVYDKKIVGGLSYSNLKITSKNSRFIESGMVPRDGKIVDYTWLYVNKSGGPDRRFKNNRKLPVMQYSEVDFKSSTGLNERIQFSKPDIAHDLISQLRKYSESDILSDNQASIA